MRVCRDAPHPGFKGDSDGKKWKYPGSCETEGLIYRSTSAQLCCWGGLWAPVVTTTAQEQVPATAPQVQQVLPSYEGQNVVSVEIAGRPDLDQERLTSLLTLRQGQPFSRAKSDQSIAALKSSAQLEDVQVEIRPQADGVRVLLVCQPAFYFGIFGFPGAEGKFAYSRLLQVSDYPPRGPYSVVDLQTARASLTKFFRAERLLL